MVELVYFFCRWIMIEYYWQQLQAFGNDTSYSVPFFVIVLVVGLIIQVIKICIDSIAQKSFSFGQFLSSGGFPSSHTGIVSSMTTLVLLHEGVFSLTFALALTFSLLFAYDAMNVRYQSGKHAKYLNELRKDLKDVLAMETRKSNLKERLGHTPLEVLGGLVLGVGLTFIFYYWFYV